MKIKSFINKYRKCSALKVSGPMQNAANTPELLKLSFFLNLGFLACNCSGGTILVKLFLKSLITKSPFKTAKSLKQCQCLNKQVLAEELLVILENLTEDDLLKFIFLNNFF